MKKTIPSFIYYGGVVLASSGDMAIIKLNIYSKEAARFIHSA